LTRLSAVRIFARVLTLTTVAVSLMLVTTAAAATDLPATTVSKTTVAVGEAFTISGTGCVTQDLAPNYVLVTTPWAVEQTMTDNYGNWSKTITLAATGGGTHAVKPECSLPGGYRPYPTVIITVSGPPPPPQWWEPGGGGPPAMPTGPPAKQTNPGPAPAPAATARVPAQAAPSAAATTAASTTTSTTTAATVATPVPPAPAANCLDCATLAGEEPLTAGQELTLIYSGFQPGEQVDVVMRSTPVHLGAFVADAAGTVTAEVTLPSSAEAGTHTLTFSGPVTGDHVVRFRLAAVGDAGETAAAPASGESDLTLPLVLGGAAVLLVAAVGLVWHRRRSARTGGPRPDAATQPTETPIAEPIA
jgi:hypothetical protein